MVDIIDNPRHSKRRRITQYQSKKAPPSPGVLGNLRNAVTGISKKLFEPPGVSASKEPLLLHRPGDPFVDSAYHSKEDSANGDITMMQDGPEAVEESITLATETDADGVMKGTPTKQKRGRRKISDIGPTSTQHAQSLKHQGVLGDAKQSMVTQNSLDLSPVKSQRTRPKERESMHGQISEAQPDIAGGEQAERGESGSVGDEDGDGVPAQTRSSGRERKKPRRFSNDMAKAARAKRPIGILTPSKEKKRGPKKAVTFGSSLQAHLDPELQFKDVATSVERRKRGRGLGKQQRDMTPETIEGPENNVSTHLEEETLDRLLPDVDTILDASSLLADSAPVDDVEMTVDTLPGYAFSFQGYCQENLTIDVRQLRDVVVEQLTGKRRVKLIGLAEEYKKVHQLVQQTVVAGEGNSALIIGSRGSGKTCLVENVILDLAEDHQDDFHVVRLNGHLQTDDRVALREIWRQLGRELEVEEDESKAISYADTMASLLALLAHPEELSSTETGSTTRSIVFVMDEFDLFASHPRQTLLYNLFDIAQARKAPIAVLGLTTKVDVAENLEKRVKSRFSHRYVHLPLPKSLTAFAEICRGMLTVEQKVSEGIDQNLLSEWDQYVQGLFQDDDFNGMLKRIYYRTKSVPDFMSTCSLPISELSAHCIPTGDSFVPESLAAPESKLHILPGLSDLELALLIAAARLDIILGTDTCNFNMVYHEYQSIAARSKIQSSASGAAALGAGSKIWSRVLSIGAWERLGESELIIPTIGAAVSIGGASGAGGGAGNRDVSREGRMFRVDVALEEILPSVRSMSSTMAKWCKEI